MSMSFGLATTLSNSQKLTPQMQQAIKLLQLSSLELAQEVQAKLDSNPLLERIENDDEYDSGDDEIEEWSEPLTLDSWNQSSSDSFDSVPTTSTEYSGDSFSDSLDKLQQPNIDDSAIDVDSYGSSDADSFDISSFETDNYASTATGSGNSRGDEDFDSYQGGTSSTIQDHVRWQLNFKRLSEADTLIAEYLIDSMDDMGFIRIDIDELLQSFDTMASFYQWDERVEKEEVLTVLRIIQSCDPVGVGARHLSECLSIQLSKLDARTEYLQEAQALLSASEHLVSNNIKALTERTGLAPEYITPALTLLRTLNASPGLLFQSSQPDYAQSPESYDIPDVLVTPVRNNKATSNSEAEEDGWYVRLNPDTLPKLRVNQEYANLVKRGDDSPDNQYLRENLTDARLFIRSIEERNQNLLKVATSIVRYQQEFLQHGATAMQPLILKAIAEEVDLHESTVSRLTTSKTILTPQGLFSLKHFFSSHVSSADGDISSTAISAMIKKLIADEDPKKPLSDSRIKDELLADGIDIARRTVAKYREAMNIGSSTQRKQKY
ncbi:MULTISPECIES: RNA polymerase factor sigma-54 [Psychrobacter]|uniref:RNA polymerase factor sigma-54 n=1 Tax=Psychrobacter TaxID=497 RepID=UPI000C331E3A|nr:MULTISPECIES: RNA polymerase factor sigma-54 [Psychrobacter]MBA6243720.1 RNA polymerase factor sigma-54 [Psychrobacter sp. Urea-trap-18]MBA6285908.1 RNA polymerase factor sigma-54 [Psychrobacter sp. Urea-trap-16]MBA6319401.1 RNA polymerase factor sigma-54 [Psychrobacter sp. Urea-trap-20]MBA6334228.1 RNA polymerase factor sigma-54 [Psychrobacter sp. Urea-trap-19]PKG60772.1 RNA polymerase sigma-54 factor [Psychrobacter sp. Choline-3u-12]